MRWTLTSRTVGNTFIMTLFDTSLFRFYELKTPTDKVTWQVSAGHANFAGQEARSFWTQLAHIVGSGEAVGMKELRASELVANEQLACLMIKGLDGKRETNAKE